MTFHVQKCNEEYNKLKLYYMKFSQHNEAI